MRPRTRQRILYAAFGLLLAGVALVIVVRLEGQRRLAAATARFELDVGDLDPTAHAPADLPDAENAAYWLQRGVAALDLSPADRAAVADLWQQDEQAPGAAVADLLDRNARAVELLRRAGELPRSAWGLPYAAGPVTKMPDLLGPLTAARVVLADARAGLAAGDRRRVLADARALAATQRALRREPVFVFQLIANAVEPGHHRLVQDLLESGLADEALLEELAGQLEGAAQGSLRAALAVEASWIVDGAVRVRSEEPTWWGRLRAPWEAAAGLELYRRLALASELPATRIAEAVRARPGAASVMGAIAPILIPNLVDGLEKHRAAAAARRLADLAVELRLQAVREGSYPADLSRFPAAASPDPYAAGELRYERTAGDPVLLAYPEAEALWRQRNPHPSRRGPLFVWTLPSA